MCALLRTESEEIHFCGYLKTNMRISKYLHQTPDFTGSPNLEKLDLQGCINLVEVHAASWTF